MTLALVACTGLGAEAASRPVRYDNTAGLELEIVGDMQGATAESRLTALLSRMEQSLGPALPGQPIDRKSGGGQVLSLVARRFQNDPATQHILFTSDATSDICHISRPVGRGTSADLTNALKRCVEEFSPPSEQTARNTRPAPSPAIPDDNAASGPPEFVDNWSHVEGVFFRVWYGSGVGGMVTVSYRPVVLFTDGRTFAIDDQALEDVDLAAERNARPRAFGTWSRSGQTYTIADDTGKAQALRLQDGAFFKAFPAEAAGPLSGSFQNVSGGGNSALGGDVMVGVSTAITFSADGRFQSGSSVSATNSGAQTGVSSAVGANRRHSGRYTVRNHTLTLDFDDGHQERHFFAFGSKKSPPQIASNMIFIDDAPYTSSN